MKEPKMNDVEKALFEKALDIAKKAHAGQLDKGEADYIEHPLAVSSMIEADTGNPDLKVLMDRMRPEEIFQAKVAAILHDVLEDSEVTYEHLLNHAQIPYEILEAVRLLTKREGESYEDFIDRLKPNRIAAAVKIADMTHNSDLSRIKNVSEKDRQRAEKYQRNIQRLVTYHGNRFDQ